MSKPVILCVDDEHMILTSLKSQLQNNLESCYQIELAESGEEALEIVAELRESNTDLALVIADQIMGGMYGDELLARIKQQLPKTVSIMLTGQASAQSVGDAVNKAGLFRYISKPWDEEDFILTVKTGLQSYRNQKKLIRQDGYQNALNKILQLVLKHRPFEEQLREVLSIVLQAPCFNELHKGSIFIEPLDHIGPNKPELMMISYLNHSDAPSRALKDLKSISPSIQLICRSNKNSYYQAPIILQGTVMGVMYLYVDPSHCEPPQTEEFISSVCHTLSGMARLSQYTLAIENHSVKLEELVELRTDELNKALAVQAKNNDLLLKTNHELEYFATTDELTGLLNRRCFFERADQEAYRSKRYKRNMMLAMLDLDFFKTINDQFGHQAGDRVLSQIAKVIANNVREQDIIGRVGGEEFAIVMPETDIQGSKELCERIRFEIKNAVIIIDTHHVSVSASIGLTELRASESTISAGMNRADQALYGSKDKGRNLITFDYEI